MLPVSSLSRHTVASVAAPASVVASKAQDSQSFAQAPLATGSIWKRETPEVFSLAKLQLADLSKLTGDEMVELERRTAGRLGRHITKVTLPLCSNAVPEALASLQHLECLELPMFTGTCLDVRHLGAANGGSNRSLEVIARRARDIDHIGALQSQRLTVTPVHQRKVVLWRYASPRDAKPIGGALPGYAYYREPNNSYSDSQTRLQEYAEVFAKNLNGEAHFEGDGEPIVCRHLALALWEQRLEYFRKKASGVSERFSYECFSSAENIEKSVRGGTESLFEDISKHAKDNHLVALSSWGPFLGSQFKTLEPGQHRHLLVLSTSHAMLVELQLKQKHGRPPYGVVLFYDPNITASHKRMVLDDPRRGACAIDDFLSEEALIRYFGSHDETQAVWVTVLAPAMRSAQADRAEGKRSAPLDQKGRILKDDHFMDGCTSTELHFRLNFGLTDGMRERLAEALARCAGNSKRTFELLAGKSVRQVPGLHKALTNGHAEAVRVLLELASTNALVMEKPNRESRFELLLAGDGKNNSGLFWALANGHAGAVRALLEPALKMDLDRQQRFELLLARNRDGAPGLLRALERGHLEAAQVVVEAAMQADLSRAQLLTLLAVKVGGAPALAQDRYLNDSTFFDSWLKVLLPCSLSSADKMDLLFLSGSYVVDEALLRRVSPQAECLARHLLVEAPIEAYDLSLSISSDPSKQVVAKKLLTVAPRSSERSFKLDKFIAGHEGGPQRWPDDQAELRQAIHRLFLDPELPVKEKRARLISVDKNGSSLLFRLMQCNAAPLVEAFTRACACPPFGEYRMDMLVGWNKKKEMSALSQAMAQGNLLAVQAWMAVVLALDVSEQQKEAMLRGLDPRRFDPMEHAHALPAVACANKHEWGAAVTAWAQCIARAPERHLSRAVKDKLLADAGKADLLRPERKAAWGS